MTEQMTTEQLAEQFINWLSNEGVDGGTLEFDADDPTVATVTFTFEDEELWITFYETNVALYNEVNGLLEERSAFSATDKLVAAMDLTEL